MHELPLVVIGVVNTFSHIFELYEFMYDLTWLICIRACAVLNIR